MRERSHRPAWTNLATPDDHRRSRVARSACTRATKRSAGPMRVFPGSVVNVVATAALAADRPFGGATSLASSLTLVTLVALYLADRVAVTRANGGDRASADPSDRTYAWIVVWQIAGLAALLLAPRLFPALDLPAWLWIPGLVLAWVGIGVRVWAIRTLGHEFQRVVTVTSGQRVVTPLGRIRYVRHPSYSGILLTYAGLGLAQANVASHPSPRSRFLCRLCEADPRRGAGAHQRPRRARMRITPMGVPGSSPPLVTSQ